MYVLSLTEQQYQKVYAFYRDIQQPNTNEYVKFFTKRPGLVVTIYTTNKMTLAGTDSKSEYDMWMEWLGIGNTYYETSIGSDEVGTGDIFGGITVCAAYVDRENMKELQELFIQDSKNMKDKHVIKLAKSLLKFVPYSLLYLDNRKYNDLISEGLNMNEIKTRLHLKAISNIYKKVGKEVPIYIDQFTPKSTFFSYVNEDYGLKNKITFMTKGESKKISIAVGAIIARYHFIETINQMSKDLGIQIKKGSTNDAVLVLKELITTKHPNIEIKDFVKYHFKNVQEVINQNKIT
jgi:ribonuclease HIII